MCDAKENALVLKGRGRFRVDRGKKDRQAARRAAAILIAIAMALRIAPGWATPLPAMS
jgi:hypothetical protein